MKKIMIIVLGMVFLNTGMAGTPATCEAYYKEIDIYLSKLKGIGVQQAQIDIVRQQYEQSRKQIARLPADNQAMACQQELDVLEQAVDAAGIK
ncbi:DUF5339 domain-containing protein [Salmonella enterica subsp. enterica]|nr:hypothetical protein [Salmonella enterica]EBS1146624.1 hypothetical protein [Salmonella enterica subsp. enterica serovar Stanley]